jgi:hypothetical protein
MRCVRSWRLACRPSSPLLPPGSPQAVRRRSSLAPPPRVPPWTLRMAQIGHLRVLVTRFAAGRRRHPSRSKQPSTTWRWPGRALSSLRAVALDAAALRVCMGVRWGVAGHTARPADTIAVTTVPGAPHRRAAAPGTAFAPRCSNGFPGLSARQPSEGSSALPAPLVQIQSRLARQPHPQSYGQRRHRSQTAPRHRRSVPKGVLRRQVQARPREGCTNPREDQEAIMPTRSA